MMNDMSKKNFGKMTFMEKKLNLEDLRSFKNKDQQTVHSLVPGINNIQSTGSKPLMIGAMKMMQESSPMKRAKGSIYFGGDRGNSTSEYYASNQH